MTEYAELHAHSNFSFLDGVSTPEELVVEAVRLGLSAIAITDHDGLYGAVQFARAARQHNMSAIYGAELSFGLTRRQNGLPDTEGEHLVVLARNPTGYALLSSAIAKAQLDGKEKGKPEFDLTQLASAHGGQWLVLTGCRKGAVPDAIVNFGPRVAQRRLDELVDVFGKENVAVEIWDHNDPLDSARNDAMATMASTRGINLVATSNAHYATPNGYRTSVLVAAIRARRSLDQMDGWQASGPGRHLRGPIEQAQRFSRYPGAVERAGELGREIAFDLTLIAPRLPPYPTPDGQSEIDHLRQLVESDAVARYGSRAKEQVVGAWAQLDHELSVIGQLGFAGYFLVVYAIVCFCKKENIFVQGRGSAANSAVCYVLGITLADPVRLGLMFERFLSPARDGPPDIDLDIEAGRREEVIQHVYERYGRRYAAQVANVITYRLRSAVRDVARALGHSGESIDKWSSELKGMRHSYDLTLEQGEIPAQVLSLAGEIVRFPRHLGVHNGGMVLCDRPIAEVCPVEWATKQGRTVLQWDKEDCAAIGLVKFDLLGLGMLSALHRAVDVIAQYHKVTIDLASIPQESKVYAMLSAADTVGVFQVESRAQMGTLPRLRPESFYDLVVEVALIRPGPIQGGSVHPYLRRRNGEEPVTYLHPLLEPVLRRTLGVPLFQEQLMEMSVAVAGFSPVEADELRQAMSAKRSGERMEKLRGRFYAGMRERGVIGAVADEIWEKMAAFANFGFPESHSVSFAYLVYSSAWLKLHYPQAFLVALLDSQPMGFWSPRSLVADARRHGVEVRRPDVQCSAASAKLEETCHHHSQPAVRLGLTSIRHIETEVAERIATNQPYESLEDIARRCWLNEAQLEALATAGALARLPFGAKRSSLWASKALAEGQPGQFPGMTAGIEAPPLPVMTKEEEAASDLWATGIDLDVSLTELVRGDLTTRGVITADKLSAIEPGQRVTVAGIVTHRQRPETALGTTFINLEDETGLVNVVCSPGCWLRYRRVAASAGALVVRGRLESSHNVCNVIADRIEALHLAAHTPSRDFA